MNPSYEQLENELQHANEKIKVLEQLLEKALERIRHLENQLSKNSKNSSKPPSSDQKGNTSEKMKKKRPTRAGKARAMYPPERVDHHIQCKRSFCPHCRSRKLEQLEKDPFSWQQAELPAVQAIVTQYDCLKYACKNCGRRSLGELPMGVPFSAFGPKLMAFIGCLTGRFHLSKRESISLVHDLYGIEVSEGSVINVEENITKALNEVYERINRYVIQGVLPRHFDETTWRDSGKRHYAWLGTNASAACYRIDRRRSQEAFCHLIGAFTPLASVTDRYNAYNILDGPHQYCLAHLIRDFHAFAERKGEDRQKH